MSFHVVGGASRNLDLGSIMGYMSKASALLWLTLALGFGIRSVAQSSPDRSQTPPTNVLAPEELFKRVSPSVFQVEALDEKGTPVASGSAVVTASNELVTNKHVVDEGLAFRIRQNGETWAARITHIDSRHDLCRLRVEGLNGKPVSVRISSTLAVGERVYAIGAPEGLELTLSEGLISGLREIDGTRVVQTSAAISPGSSGGGLFDSQGRLVGITTFYAKEGQNLNFALPAELLASLGDHPVSEEAIRPKESPEFSALTEELALSQLAQESLKGGRYDKAIAATEQLIDLEQVHKSPMLWMSWKALGSLYLESGNSSGANDAYLEAVHLNPEDGEAWRGLGVTILAVGTMEQSADAFAHAIRLNPQDALAWYGLGTDLHFQGKTSEVLKVYEQIKKIDPAKADEFYRNIVLK